MCPRGPIWEKLCDMYGLIRGRTISATAVFDRMTDPASTWDSHYMYCTYRDDESWRGMPCNKFETTPVLDITRLPAFHYLTHEQAEHMATVFRDRQDDGTALPLWLKVPDFYLPSRNIQHAMDKDPDFLIDLDAVKILSVLSK